ncbi:4-hydroxy-tetrahydrodipicolinate reductase [Aureimonas sp. AU20]|uniref:4-hydroxy-tetrahydrodipicolinate reductase n=1 Tax=Aureimonas sp. AU20 TaxID=1349819 RepID=UPI00071FCB7D|nr:4-hydroxy-tetrahydrodipicolinate reductase [Aureimonas sp. AU20]ALN71721.1 hypothetical protein M673_03290 [Aureimonas sp. AU20]
MSEAMKLVILGAAGRMGRTLVRVVKDSEGAKVVAAIEREGSLALGADCGELAASGHLGVPVTSDLAKALDAADGVIDFTAPALSVAVARETARRGLVHVIGTTGCSAEDDAAIAQAAEAGARIVKSGNMSLGVNLLAVLAEQAARALGPDAFDIEILEMHHRHKVDAPSGTALLLGQAAAEGRAVALNEQSVRVRDGHTGARQAGTIGFATLRGGSVVGDHQVILAGEGERIELGHRAEDRAIFARGALRAALWARAQAPGLYSMRQVLGF